MAHVMRIIQRADGVRSHYDGRYVMDCRDTPDGMGIYVTSPKLEDARRFADAGEAMAFWNRISATRRWRPDGKPNKPLTAFTVSIVPEDKAPTP